jgi:hypothetical protein
LRNASEYSDASEYSEELIVGVSTDELSITRKSKQLSFRQHERVEVVPNVRYVDRELAQSSMDKMATWHGPQFDVMFIGDKCRGTTEWDRIEHELGLGGVCESFLPPFRSAHAGLPIAVSDSRGCIAIAHRPPILRVHVAERPAEHACAPRAVRRAP